jgi:DNA-binding response OmpR family regulator
MTAAGARAGDEATVVLLVEDDEELLQVLAETVERLGYTPTLSATAAEAERTVKARRPDAIILDIALPDASGTMALTRLHELRPDVPIIMLTANTDESLARATLQHGAFDYIMKPFDNEHFTQVLEAAMASSLPRRQRWHDGA